MHGLQNSCAPYVFLFYTDYAASVVHSNTLKSNFGIPLQTVSATIDNTEKAIDRAVESYSDSYYEALPFTVTSGSDGATILANTHKVCILTITLSILRLRRLITCLLLMYQHIYCL